MPASSAGVFPCKASCGRTSLCVDLHPCKNRRDGLLEGSYPFELFVNLGKKLRACENRQREIGTAVAINNLRNAVFGSLVPRFVGSNPTGPTTFVGSIETHIRGLGQPRSHSVQGFRRAQGEDNRSRDPQVGGHAQGQVSHQALHIAPVLGLG